MEKVCFVLIHPFFFNGYESYDDLIFIGVFSGVGISKSAFDVASALTMVTGVFLGSGCWWLSLSFAISLARSKFTNNSLIWINRISGAVVLTFGIFALYKLL
ncbi:LysE family transporter [Priestia megaterium]